MSLTSELDRAESWVNQFFKEQFGRVTEFTRVEGPGIKALETIVPTDMRGNITARIGTAFDYRLRLALGAAPLDSGVVSGGIYRMAVLGGHDFDTDVLVRWVMDVMRCLAKGEEQSEEELAKTAILMAHLDAGFRSMGMWAEEMRLLAQFKAAAMLEDERIMARGWTRNSEISEVARPEEVDEVVGLIAVAKDALNFESFDSVAFGPTFVGSRYVGGADADLVSRGQLLDIKTTSQPRRDLTITIRQLIGYALLDWDDEHNISEAGIYFSRQGKMVSWSMDELIRRTATDINASLVRMRKKFKDAAESNVHL